MKKHITTKRHPKIEQLIPHKQNLKMIVQIFNKRSAYETAQKYLLDNNIEISLGTLYKFFKTYFPKYVTQNKIKYGFGDQTVTGRVFTKEFVCQTTREHYVRKNGKWEKIYRLIMSDELKQGKDLVVHHVNGDHFDNRPCNLQVMTRKEHALLHSYLKYKMILQVRKEKIS